jgi:predicted ArsR family transcriptional regulator
MDRLTGIGTPELRELLLYVRGEAAPVSADDAAAALGVHRTVARGRLERLAEAGLLEATFARRSGRSGPGAGRPAKLYSAAPESEALEFPPHRFPELVGLLLEELPRRGRRRALNRVGEDFGRRLARAARLRPTSDHAAGLERICAAVRSLGFQASLERFDGEVAVVATPTCPLRPLVADRPEAAEIDRGMWAGLVERGLRGVEAGQVACETHSCLDSDAPCSVVIHLRTAEKPQRRSEPGRM